MKIRKYLRCPHCDGKIIIPNEFERLPNLIEIPKLSFPRCTKCGAGFKVSIKTKDFIEIELEEVN